MRRRRRLTAAVAGVLVVILVPVAGFGASYARTELLRQAFERQFWQEAAFPTAEVLGRRSELGRIVVPGTGEAAQGHCDFLAEAVYGVQDEYEAVEDHYRARTIAVGGQPPVTFTVEPVSDRALSNEVVRPGDPDDVMRELFHRTGTDLVRARTFRTVYAVQAVSWGHAAFLDWRCR